MREGVRRAGCRVVDGKWAKERTHKKADVAADREVGSEEVDKTPAAAAAEGEKEGGWVRRAAKSRTS